MWWHIRVAGRHLEDFDQTPSRPIQEGGKGAHEGLENGIRPVDNAGPAGERDWTRLKLGMTQRGQPGR